MITNSVSWTSNCGRREHVVQERLAGLQCLQILGGIADTVAQSLTAIRAKSRRNLSLGKDISDGIEMPEYNDEKSPYSTEFMIPHRSFTSPPSFDFERLTRFMAYGFLMSPLQFQWFAFLSRSFPITKQSATMPALYRVCFDQLIFAPVGMSRAWTSS